MNDSTIDLVVTSHNYFWIDPGRYVNAEPIIDHLLINQYLSEIEPKARKPLVIGFDLEDEEEETSGKNKKKGKKKKSGGKHAESDWNPDDHLNPFGGIDAIVCALTLDRQRKFQLETYIWEAWNPGGCNQKGFDGQNHARIFLFKNKKIGLLSCGDIFLYCRDDIALLPKANLYLDLVHSAYTRRHKKTPIKIFDQNKADSLLITMQVKDVGLYERGYPWVFPNVCVVSTELREFPEGVRDTSWFAFVDCVV